MDMAKRNKRTFGSLGESIADKYLCDNNFKILERNFRAGRYGEIDIIAREKEYICFIEVKTRTSTLYGMPSEAVNVKKQDCIRKIAAIYIARYRLHNENIRFDILEILGTRDKCGNFNTASINLIRNAF